MKGGLLIRPYKTGFRTYLHGTALSRKPVELERAVQQADALRRKGRAKDIQAYPLTDTDMRTVIPTLKILAYPELLRATSIDEVLDEKGRLMLLYLTENEHTGHWVCLLKLRGTNIVEYFDPYGGFKPDGEARWLDTKSLEQFGQATKHLSHLLNTSPYDIKSNAVPFQSEERNMNTCGRHCLCRLYLKHLTLPEYARMVQKACKDGDMTPDDFVSGFTYYLIGK